jgi:histidyl-tRNA synthetase
VKQSLDKQEIPYVINHRLVRGLDYYCRTAFEIQTSELGAQNAVAGGGRYDGLVEMLGGPSHPAVGFAIGMDRVADLMLQQNPQAPLAPDVFIASLGDEATKKAFVWSCALGRAGIRNEIDFSGKSLKSSMKRADRTGAKLVLIAGEQELNDGSVIVRNMKTKEQISVPIENIVEGIQRLINKKH